MLLATDGNAQPIPSKAWVARKISSSTGLLKPANLAGDGDHHAAQSPESTPPCQPNFHAITTLGKKDHDQQQTFNFR